MSKPVSGAYAPYFEKYISLVDADTIHSILEKYAEKLETFYSTLPDSKGDYLYAPGKWTLKALLQHVTDTERIMSYRLLRISRNDQTPLASFDENSFAENAGADQRTFDSIKAEFLAVRKATNLLLLSLNEGQLAFTGVTSGHPTTTNALAYIIFGHMLHHQSVIQERYL